MSARPGFDFRGRPLVARAIRAVLNAAAEPEPAGAGPVSPHASEGARRWEHEAKSEKPRCVRCGFLLSPKGECVVCE